MKYIQYLIIGITSIAFLSCETNVDASDLIEKQQFIVINGYLSPQDTTLKVQVSRSKSRASVNPTDSRDLVITTASVVISDEEENEVTLSYNTTSLSYEAPATDLSILPGKKYFLKAMVEGNEYKASCEIPVGLVQNIENEIRDDNDPFSVGNKILELKIEDIKDQRNFYVNGAQLKNTSEPTGNNFEVKVDFEFEQFTTDSSRENAIINAKGFFQLTEIPSNTILKMQVANTEKILYEALRATYLNDYNDDDPFFEPVIAPTNIDGKNGFGVFAGFQLTEKEITL